MQHARPIHLLIVPRQRPGAVRHEAYADTSCGRPEAPASHQGLMRLHRMADDCRAVAGLGSGGMDAVIELAEVTRRYSGDRHRGAAGTAVPR
jgi:hypothetical protein